MPSDGRRVLHLPKLSLMRPVLPPPDLLQALPPAAPWQVGKWGASHSCRARRGGVQGRVNGMACLPHMQLCDRACGFAP